MGLMVKYSFGYNSPPWNTHDSNHHVIVLDDQILILFKINMLRCSIQDPENMFGGPFQRCQSCHLGNVQNPVWSLATVVSW